MDCPGGKDSKNDQRNQAENLSEYHAESPKDQAGNANALIQVLLVRLNDLEFQNQELQKSMSLLEKSRNLYFDLFDLAPVALLRLNRHNTIEEFNKCAFELLGNSVNLQGMPLTNFIDKGCIEAFQDHIATLSEKQACEPLELDLNCAQNQKTVVQCRTSTLWKDPDILSYLIALADVDVLKKTEEILLASERECNLRLLENSKKLEATNKRLNEAKIALKVLLENRENDKTEIQESIMSNLQTLILPFLEKARAADHYTVRSRILDAIENSLRDITVTFSRKLRSVEYGLSQRELEVAELVKNGKTSDEIADILSISLSSVMFHRANIRKKLGIKGKKIRLAVCLRNLE